MDEVGMRLARSLNVGEKFRVAHPKQVSANNIPMPRESTFKVTKVYEMSPNLIVAVPLEGDRRPRTLFPGTPVLFVPERDPSEDEVLEFLGICQNRTVPKKVVAYRLLWDGQTPIVNIVSRRAFAVLRVMHVHGRREYTVRELNRLLEKDFQKFYSRPLVSPTNSLMMAFRRKLVAQGLIEEVLDEAPAPKALVDAGLTDVWHRDGAEGSGP